MLNIITGVLSLSYHGINVYWMMYCGTEMQVLAAENDTLRGGNVEDSGDSAVGEPVQ